MQPVTLLENADNARSTASRALQLMALYRVPATPQNFEVWFRFVVGSRPELNRAINILITNKHAFDAATNKSLYATYVEAHPNAGAECGGIPDQLRKVLEDAQEFLAKTLNDNRDHIAVLDGVATQIQTDSDPRSIIQRLTGELSKAVARATNLEAHFSASLQEVDRIRGNLATVERRSKTDALTGLANRVALDEFLRSAQADAMESGKALTIFLVDVDHFKNFNDKFGHQFGDEVLRLISQILKSSLRECDLAARYGGEELVGVLPGADLGAGKAVAERARLAIGRRQVTRRGTGEILSNLTVSIGVAQFVPGETVANLFERCDRALYAAKRRGRNCTVTETDG